MFSHCLAMPRITDTSRIPLIVALIICHLPFSHQAASNPPGEVKVHAIGNATRAVANVSPWPAYAGPVCLYPFGAGLENMRAGYPFVEIAARVPPAMAAQPLYTRWLSPSTEPRDTIWVVRDFSRVDIPYWPGYMGVSDEDFVFRFANQETTLVNNYCSVTENQAALSLPPLAIDVVVQSMAWELPPLDQVFVYCYRVIPRSFDLRQVFLSLYFQGGIGSTLDYPSWRPYDDRSIFYENEHLGLIFDGDQGAEGLSANVVGYRVFPPLSVSPSSLRWTTKDDFTRSQALNCLSSPQEYGSAMYQLLSSGAVFTQGGYLGSNWIAVGPFDVSVGDTLEFWTAEILGRGSGDVFAKNTLLNTLATRRFVTPQAPPPPPLRADRGDRSITLRWDARTGDNNPETYQDPGRWDSVAVPFEGYRVYRSTHSIHGPWTLLAEYDIAGDGVASEIGLRRDYIDSGLLNNSEYFYAVTSFSKPDSVIGLPSKESKKERNAVKAIPGHAPKPRVGEVAAVPNPYRGDIAYYLYDPPWEKPTGKWTTWFENDRRIQFINLPVRCTIRIYTLAGDIIETLHHDDGTVSYHDWNLTSYVGQAVASGLYLFSVEDAGTGEVQVGKFVILR
jgi:hypothetical protein